MDAKVRATYLYMLHTGTQGFLSDDLEYVRKYSIETLLALAQPKSTRIINVEATSWTVE